MEELSRTFQHGFERPARQHQVQAVQKVLAWLSEGHRRALMQHAAGSGKTETIGLLAFEALRRRLFSHVVVLNYAVDLEEQAVERLRRFWKNLRAVHMVHHERATSCDDIKQTLTHDSVYFTLLQKFVAPEDDSEAAIDSDAELPAEPKVATQRETSCRILVIVDEAHRGIPEEGAHIKAVEARYGAMHSQVLFTATPKSETLLSHGIRLHDGRFKALHYHTQREAVASRYILNPLEFYTNCVPSLEVSGMKLAAMKEPVSMDNFEARLNDERNSKAIMEQRARLVMEKMPEVYSSSPVMTQRGHQIKVMIVLPTIQAVYDFGQLLRARAKNWKTALGKPFVIGSFFSLRAKKKTGNTTQLVSEREANNGVTIDACDIIVTCRKYLTGFDEWRICAVFLATRISQPEYLQQILGRANRARPGEGKRRPLIFDMSNNPDSVFASVTRFWEETCYYPEPLGELKMLQGYIDSFPGIRVDDAQASLDKARRLPVSDRVLLRAALVSYWRAARGVSACSTPVQFKWLHLMLEGLNMDLCDKLFGGSSQLAKLAARDVASGQEPRSSSNSAAAASAAVQSVKTVPAALKRLRDVLKLGRRKRPRQDAQEEQRKKRREPTTPQSERTLLAADLAPALSVECLTPQKMPVSAAPLSEATEIRAGLEAAVTDIVARFEKSLPAEGDEDTPDRREAELERFDFAAAPLRKLRPAVVAAARKKLSCRLNRSFGNCLKASWARQRAACEADFKERLPRIESRAEAMQELDVLCVELQEIVGTVGGQVAGSLRGAMRRGMSRQIGKRFPDCHSDASEDDAPFALGV